MTTLHLNRLFSSFCVLALSLTLANHAAAQRQGDPIEIEIGQQTSVSAEGVQSYSEGRRGIADVRLTRDQSRFVIVGQSAGQTSLLLIMQDGSQVQYPITVTDPNEENPTDPSAVNVRENIRLDLYFVSLSDSYSHAIGVAWPAVIGAAANTGSSATLDFSRSVVTPDGAAGAGQNEISYGISGVTFLPRLDLAQNNGWARIYRQGTLITANGTEAKFRAGGEVNIVTQNSLGTRLVTIDFGTEVECRPRYDSDTGRVELRIIAQVADLTGEGSSGVPGRSVTTIDTLVNLELGQSLVLAGFTARSESRAREGLPGLSQIPVLGVLFGSHSRRYEESEGLMFIVPSVADAVPLRRRNRIVEAMRAYEDFDGGVDEVELTDHPSIPGVSVEEPSDD